MKRLWRRAQVLILAVSLLWTPDRLPVSHAQPPPKCEGLVAKMKVPSQVSIGGEGPSRAKIKALIGNKGQRTITNITLGLHLPQGLSESKRQCVQNEHRCQLRFPTLASFGCTFRFCAHEKDDASR